MSLQVVVRKFGGPDVLETVDRAVPEPGPGQVAIANEAVGVTFIDTQLRAGRSPGMPLPELPWVPGTTVAGRVVALGLEVPQDLLGAAVAARTGASGGYADVSVASATQVMRLPDGVDARFGVTALADGRTALAVLDAMSPQPGETVLILAAAGGVGSLLTELVAAEGARVIGAAGSSDKQRMLQEVSWIHEAHDYSHDQWWRDVSPVDAVVDGVGGRVGTDATRIMTNGGRFVVLGHASGTPTDLEPLNNQPVGVIHGWRLVQSDTHARALAQRALTAMAAGQLHPRIGQTFALSAARQAHAAIEDRLTRGKTLLIPNGASHDR